MPTISPTATATPIAESAVTAAQPLCGPWEFTPSDRVVAAVTGVAVWAVVALVASGVLPGAQEWVPPAAFLARGDWKAALANFLAPGLWMHVIAVLASVYALFASRYIRLRLRSSPHRFTPPGFVRANLDQMCVRGLSGAGEWLAFLPLLQIVGVVLSSSSIVLALPAGFSFVAGFILGIGVFVSAFSPTKKPPLGDWLALTAFATWQFVLFPVVGKLWRQGFPI